MALLWCDGFDHYGSNEDNMLDGAYAWMGSGGSRIPPVLSTAQAANGTHSVYFSDNDTSSANNGLRKVLPSAKDKMGAIGRFYFPGLPNSNTDSHIFGFQTADPDVSQVGVCVDAQGCLRFYRGTTTTSGTQIAISDPIIVSNAWNHIEVQVYIHDTLGWVRAAVNGVHRFEATGLDTKHNSDNIASVLQHILPENNASLVANDFYMDDYILYDFSGNSAVDTDWCPPTDGSGIATGYIGELQCLYLPVNGDTAEADWLKSSGSSGYALADELDPNDADYVYSTAAGDLSEFDLQDLPEDITYIRGVQLLGRMSKSDSGSAMIKYGMNSDGTTEDSAEFPITQEPTYWWTFQNTDPDTDARWTRLSLNAAKRRVLRSV